MIFGLLLAVHTASQRKKLSTQATVQ